MAETDQSIAKKSKSIQISKLFYQRHEKLQIDSYAASCVQNFIREEAIRIGVGILLESGRNLNITYADFQIAG